MRWINNFNIIVLCLYLITPHRRIVYVHWVIIEFNFEMKLWWIWITLGCAWNLSSSHHTSIFINVNRHYVVYKIHQNMYKNKIPSLNSRVNAQVFSLYAIIECNGKSSHRPMSKGFSSHKNETIPMHHHIMYITHTYICMCVCVCVCVLNVYKHVNTHVNTVKLLQKVLSLIPACLGHSHDYS